MTIHNQKEFLTLQNMAGLLVAIPLGLLSAYLPADLVKHPPLGDPLFPRVWAGYEGASWPFFLLLFLSGLILGLCFIQRSSPIGFKPLLLGSFTMAALPVLSIIEMSIKPNSHNLWPIEFVIYAIISLVAVVGVYGGIGIKRLLVHSPAISPSTITNTNTPAP